jgi:hypothetical protein
MNQPVEDVGLHRTDGCDASLAEAMIAMFLRRCERRKRHPDVWESWHMLMALQALGNGQYRETIQCIGAALLDPCQRPPFRPPRIPERPRNDRGMRLATLQALFEGVRLPEPSPAVL